MAGPASGTRWKLTLEYDGSGFAGWGVQPNQRTVQGTVEDALARFLGHAVRIEASGRTDAGVHALGQVAALSTDRRRTPESMRDGLNHHLPDDVACVGAEPVAADFNPRRHVRIKHYRYTMLVRPARSPLLRERAWHLRHPLDVPAMHEAVQALAGTWDFQTFRASGCAVSTSVRTIPRWEVTSIGDRVLLDVHGHGFLQHMIRIVAGSLVEVGRGRRPPGWIAEIRDKKDRTVAGRTAPAAGLTLVSVTYPSDSGRLGDSDART